MHGRSDDKKALPPQVLRKKKSEGEYKLILQEGDRLLTPKQKEEVKKVVDKALKQRKAQDKENETFKIKKRTGLMSSIQGVLGIEKGLKNSVLVTFDEGNHQIWVYPPHKQSLLGSGGFGKVRLVQNLDTDEWGIVKGQQIIEDFAVFETKVVREHLTEDEKERYGATLERIKPKKGSRPEFQQHLMVQKLIPGAELKYKNMKEAKMTQSGALKMLTCISGKLIALHKKGYLHRDINSKNVIYDVDNNNGEFIDFGLSVEYKSKPIMGYSAGTMKYMAPEILTTKLSKKGGKKAIYSEASDVYALGITLAEALGFTTDIPTAQDTNTRKETLKSKLENFDRKQKYNFIKNVRMPNARLNEIKREIYIRTIIKKTPSLHITERGLKLIHQFPEVFDNIIESKDHDTQKMEDLTALSKKFYNAKNNSEALAALLEIRESALQAAQKKYEEEDKKANEKDKKIDKKDAHLSESEMLVSQLGDESEFRDDGDSELSNHDNVIAELKKQQNELITRIKLYDELTKEKIKIFLDDPLVNDLIKAGRFDGVNLEDLTGDTEKLLSACRFYKLDEKPDPNKALIENPECRNQVYECLKRMTHSDITQRPTMEEVNKLFNELNIEYGEPEVKVEADAKQLKEDAKVETKADSKAEQPKEEPKTDSKVEPKVDSKEAKAEVEKADAKVELNVKAQGEHKEEVKEAPKKGIRLRVFYWPNKNAGLGHISIEVEDIVSGGFEYISWAMWNFPGVDIRKHKRDPIILTKDISGKDLPNFKQFIKYFERSDYAFKARDDEESYRKRYNIATKNCVHSVKHFLQYFHEDVGGKVYKPATLYQAVADSKSWQVDNKAVNSDRWTNAVLHAYLACDKDNERQEFKQEYFFKKNTEKIKNINDANQWLDAIAKFALERCVINDLVKPEELDKVEAKIKILNELMRDIKKQYPDAKIGGSILKDLADIKSYLEKNTKNITRDDLPNVINKRANKFKSVFQSMLEITGQQSKKDEDKKEEDNKLDNELKGLEDKKAEGIRKDDVISIYLTTDNKELAKADFLKKIQNLKEANQFVDELIKRALQAKNDLRVDNVAEIQNKLTRINELINIVKGKYKLVRINQEVLKEIQVFVEEPGDYTKLKLQTYFLDLLAIMSQSINENLAAGIMNNLIPIKNFYNVQFITPKQEEKEEEKEEEKDEEKKEINPKKRVYAFSVESPKLITIRDEENDSSLSTEDRLKHWLTESQDTALHYQHSLGRCLATALLLSNEPIVYSNIVLVNTDSKPEFALRTLGGAFDSSYSKSIPRHYGTKNILDPYSLLSFPGFIQGMEKIVNISYVDLKKLIHTELESLIQVYGEETVKTHFAKYVPKTESKGDDKSGIDPVASIELALYHVALGRKFLLKKKVLTAKISKQKGQSDFEDLIKANPFYFTLQKGFRDWDAKKYLRRFSITSKTDDIETIFQKKLIKVIQSSKNFKELAEKLITYLANMEKSKTSELTELKEFLKQIIQPPFDPRYMRSSDEEILVQACDEAYRVLNDQFKKLNLNHQKQCIALIQTQTLITAKRLRKAIENKAEPAVEVSSNLLDIQPESFIIVDAKYIINYLKSKAEKNEKEGKEVKRDEIDDSKLHEISAALMQGRVELIKAIDLISQINGFEDIRTDLQHGFVWIKDKEGGGNRPGPLGAIYQKIGTVDEPGKIYLLKQDTEKEHNVEKDISEFVSANIINAMFGDMAPTIIVRQHPGDPSPYIGSEYFSSYQDLDKDIYRNYYQIPLIDEMLVQLDRNETLNIDNLRKKAGQRVGSLDNEYACSSKFKLLLNQLVNQSKETQIDLIVQYRDKYIQKIPEVRTRNLGTHMMLGTTHGKIVEYALLRKNANQTLYYEDIEKALVASLMVADFDTHIKNLGAITVMDAKYQEFKKIKRIDLGAALQAKHFKDKADVHMEAVMPHGLGTKAGKKLPKTEPTNHIREYPTSIKISHPFANAILEGINKLEVKLNEAAIFGDLKPWPFEDLFKFAGHIGVTPSDIKAVKQNDQATLISLIEKHMRQMMDDRINAMTKLYLEIKISLFFKSTWKSLSLDSANESDLINLIRNPKYRKYFDKFLKKDIFTLRGDHLSSLDKYRAKGMLREKIKEIIEMVDDEKQAVEAVQPSLVDHKYSPPVDEKVAVNDSAVEVKKTDYKIEMKNYSPESLGHILFTQLQSPEDAKRKMALQSIIDIAGKTDSHKQKNFLLSMLSLIPEDKKLEKKDPEDKEITIKTLKENLKKHYDEFYFDLERERKLRDAFELHRRILFKQIDKNKSALARITDPKQEKVYLKKIKELSAELKELSKQLKKAVEKCQDSTKKSALKATIKACYQELHKHNFSVEDAAKIELATIDLCKAPKDYPCDFLQQTVVSVDSKDSDTISLVKVREVFVNTTMSQCLFVSPKSGGANDPGKLGGNYIKCWVDSEGRIHSEIIFFKQATKKGLPEHRENIAEVIAGQVMMDIIGENAAGVMFAMTDRVPVDEKDADADQSYVGSIFLHHFESAHEAGIATYLEDNFEKKKAKLIKHFENEIIAEKYKNQSRFTDENLAQIKQEAIDRFNRRIDKSLLIEPRKPLQTSNFKKGLSKLINTSEQEQKRRYEFSLGRGIGVSLLLGNYQIHSENIGIADIAKHREFCILDYGGAFRRVFRLHGLLGEVEHGQLEREIAPFDDSTKKFFNYMKSYPKEVRLSKGFIDGLDYVATFDPKAIAESVERNIDYAIKYYGENAFVEHFARELDTTGQFLRLTKDPKQNIASVKQFLSFRLIERQVSLKKFVVDSKLNSIKAGNTDFKKEELVAEHPVYMLYREHQVYMRYRSKVSREATAPAEHFLLDVISKYSYNINHTAYIFHAQVQKLLNADLKLSDELKSNVKSLQTFLANALKPGNYDPKNMDDACLLMQACDEAFTTINKIYKQYDKGIVFRCIKTATDEAIQDFDVPLAQQLALQLSELRANKSPNAEIMANHPIYFQYRMNVAPKDVENPLQLFLLDKIRENHEDKVSLESTKTKHLVENFRLQIAYLSNMMLNLDDKNSKKVKQSLKNLQSYFENILRNNDYDFNDKGNQDNLFLACDEAYRVLGEAYQLLPKTIQNDVLKEAEEVLWPLINIDSLEKEFLAEFKKTISNEEEIVKVLKDRVTLFLEYKLIPDDGRVHTMSITLTEAEQLGFTFDSENLTIKYEKPFSGSAKVIDKTLLIFLEPADSDPRGEIKIQGAHVEKRALDDITYYRTQHPDITLRQWLIVVGAMYNARSKLLAHPKLNLESKGIHSEYEIRQSRRKIKIQKTIPLLMLPQCVELIRGMKKPDRAPEVKQPEVKANVTQVGLPNPNEIQPKAKKESKVMPNVERKAEPQPQVGIINPQQQSSVIKPVIQPVIEQKPATVIDQKPQKISPALSAQAPAANDSRINGVVPNEQKAGKTAIIQAQRQSSPAQIFELIQSKTLLSDLQKTVDIKPSAEVLKENELSEDLKQTIKKIDSSKTYHVKTSAPDAGGIFVDRMVGSNYSIYVLQSPTKGEENPDDYFNKVLSFAHKQLMAFVMNKGRTIYVRTEDKLLAKAYMAIGIANNLNIFNYSPSFTEAERQALIAEVRQIKLPEEYLNLKFSRLEAGAFTNGMKEFVTWCGKMQSEISLAKQEIEKNNKTVSPEIQDRLQQSITTCKSMRDNILNNEGLNQDKEFAKITSNNLIKEIEETLNSSKQAENENIDRTQANRIRQIS